MWVLEGLLFGLTEAAILKLIVDVYGPKASSNPMKQGLLLWLAKRGLEFSLGIAGCIDGSHILTETASPVLVRKGEDVSVYVRLGGRQIQRLLYHEFLNYPGLACGRFTLGRGLGLVQGGFRVGSWVPVPSYPSVKGEPGGRIVIVL